MLKIPISPGKKTKNPSQRITPWNSAPPGARAPGFDNSQHSGRKLIAWHLESKGAGNSPNWWKNGVFLMGKIIYEWEYRPINLLFCGCSIAMFDYQRVKDFMETVWGWQPHLATECGVKLSPDLTVTQKLPEIEGFQPITIRETHKNGGQRPSKMLLSPQKSRL